MATNELKKEWEARIADFKASGKSGATWCTANNVNIHQFYYWVKKLKSSNSADIQSPKWYSLEISTQSQDPTNNLLIRVGEVTIEVKPDYNPDLLLNVIRTLRTIC
jgi:hypothetical protein